MKNELPQAAIILVDREGKKTEQGRSDPFAASLAMKLEVDGLVIEMRAFSSPYSNGSSWVKIREGRKVLYEGGGDYFSLGAGTKPKIYKPGPWEKKLLARSKPYVASIK